MPMEPEVGGSGRAFLKSIRISINGGLRGRWPAFFEVVQGQRAQNERVFAWN